MKRIERHVVGTLALLTTAALALCATPKVSDAIYEAKLRPLGHRVVKSFETPPDLSQREYDWREQALWKAVDKLDKKIARSKGPKTASYMEKRRRYYQAIKETRLRSFFHKDPPILTLKSGGEYRLQAYCSTCFYLKDVDGLREFEKELDAALADPELVKKGFDEPTVAHYRTVLRSRILATRIAKAIDEKNDAEIKSAIDVFEETAIFDATTPEADFFYWSRHIVDMLAEYDPKLERQAKEAIRKGYKASARPMMAEADFLE